MAEQTLTMANAESAYLKAKAQFETWRERFMAQWYGPQIEMLYGAAAGELSKMPPEVRLASRQAHPEAWKQVDQLNRRPR